MSYNSLSHSERTFSTWLLSLDKQTFLKLFTIIYRRINIKCQTLSTTWRLKSGVLVCISQNDVKLAISEVWALQLCQTSYFVFIWSSCIKPWCQWSSHMQAGMLYHGDSFSSHTGFTSEDCSRLTRHQKSRKAEKEVSIEQTTQRWHSLKTELTRSTLTLYV